MPEPKPSFLESVKRTCPTCGGPLPCSLHNRALREALLHREIEPPPYERLEVLGTYTDAEGHAQDIWTLHPLPDGAVLVGGGGGSLERWGQDPEKLQQYREQVLAQKRGEIHPMPEEPMV